MDKFNYNPNEDKDIPNLADLTLHFSKGHRNLKQTWDNFGTHIKCSCGKNHDIPFSEIGKGLKTKECPSLKEMHKEQKKLIKHAKQQIDEGDFHLANYILRDSPVVKANKKLSDLAWLVHQSFACPTKDDVLYLIELIEKEMNKGS